MIIYGVAVLAGCLIAGMIVGDALGALLGVESNVGGVGFAMLLLIVLADRMRRAGHFPAHSADGVLFWSAMYIPIVIAMAANQNAVAAVSGGPAAVLAGLLSVVACVLLVPVISRIGLRDATAPQMLGSEEGL